MQIRDIMSHPARTIRASQTVKAASELMALHDVGALPVCQKDRVIGIVTDRDIVVRCLAAGLDPEVTVVSKIMSKDPVVAPPDAPADDATRMLADLRIRRLPIVEDGKAVGIVTADDIARYSTHDTLVRLMVSRLAPRRKPRAAAS
jgi:CBS domain-containing protein